MDLESIFRNELLKVIEPDDKIIVVHSALWSFGHCFGKDYLKLPDTILDVLLSFTGDNGTLVLPTYTNTFTKNKVYDVLNSKPETGVLPIHLLKRTGTIRTLSPMNNYVVIGKHAQELETLKGKTLWGKGSIMDWFYEHNARICTLGLDWHEGCSFLHYAEEVSQVPYRYYKTFKGTLIDKNGNQSACEETMFVRPLSIPSDFQYNKVTEKMDSLNLLKKSSGQIPIISGLAKDTFRACMDILDKNKYGFLKNEEEVKNWVKNDKENEVSQLRK